MMAEQGEYDLKGFFFIYLVSRFGRQSGRHPDDAAGRQDPGVDHEEPVEERTGTHAAG